MDNKNENNRSSKILIIIALLIGITCLSIGFATFSTVLTINSSLKVTPDSKYFKVNFSSSPENLETAQIVPTLSDDSKITATNGTIDNTNDPTISNLSAVFTEPGQYVTYSFYAYNTSKYLAYLNEVNFKTIDGETVTKKCIASPDARYDYVQSVCEDIELTIKVGPSLFKETDSNVTNHTLTTDTAEPVIIKITYINNDHWADGDFEVYFGDITLDYASID